MTLICNSINLNLDEDLSVTLIKYRVPVRHDRYTGSLFLFRNV